MYFHTCTSESALYTEVPFIQSVLYPLSEVPLHFSDRSCIFPTDDGEQAQNI